ncbi:TonB-dependent receptor [Altererythrobacter sp. ZODW24]|uniref:TonB-dependent receptor n=1 Tax=Altererythrobacter sp. ZODW24 TaxID=2185142 RepID=UPI000DF77B5F|nr:TonB-dependent receptor [Altererythrobacter sp. ZODW24]
MDGSLTANISLFYNDIEGYRLIQTVFVPPNRISSIGNAGDARVIGGELNEVADNGLVDCSTGDQFPASAGCQSLFGSIEGKRIPRAIETHHCMLMNEGAPAKPVPLFVPEFT